MSIRIAVIGAGIMGADHARIVAGDLPGAVLQVVCDTDGARARDVAETAGAADIATDAEAVIARADVDAVIIASPDPTHAPLTHAAIRAGKPALCEKPLSPDPAECRAVVEAEEAAGRRLLQLGLMRRFDPSYARMKAALDAGSLGRALMMHNFHRNVASPGAWFTGEMAITNSAPHEFDAARFVLGAEFTAVSAWQPKRGDGMVAPVMMVFETDAGQIVTVEVNNNAAYGYDVRGELVGETASLSLAAPVDAVLSADLRASTAYAADWRPRFAEAYRLQDKAFLRFVETGAPSAIAADAWDGHVATRVAMHAARALARGTRVEIAPEPRPDFYA